MEKETMQGVATSINAGDKNVKLIRIVAEWWRSARYLQENKSRFEPNELEAFEYILNTPARGVVDEDKFGLSVTLIREISYQNSDQFGAEASNFAGKSGKILKDISEFAQTLESQRLKASADVNINHVKRNAMAASLPATDRHNESDGSGTTRRRMINGNTWEGTFDESDNPYGSGIINYIDGSVYKGQWSAKGPHGNGTLVQEDGDIWEALFRDGKPVDGKIIYKNGNRYEGGLNENGRNGMGRTFTEYYEEYGQYEDDSRTGNGRITFKNGDFYEGGWTAVAHCSTPSTSAPTRAISSMASVRATDVWFGRLQTYAMKEAGRIRPRVWREQELPTPCPTERVRRFAITTATPLQ